MPGTWKGRFWSRTMLRLLLLLLLLLPRLLLLLLLLRLLLLVAVRIPDPLFLLLLLVVNTLLSPPPPFPSASEPLDESSPVCASSSVPPSFSPSLPLSPLTLV